MKPLTARLLTILFVLSLLAPAVEARKSSIRRIDFRNFTFPGVWNKKPITLRNGKLEIVGKPCPHFNYTLEDVDYIDLDGDGDEEALVHVQDFTGCVSSSVYQNFYIYRMRKGRAHLVWKFATGTEGEAGLKDFGLDGRVLVFELFGKHQISGSKPRAAGENFGGDCCPRSYSRIRVAWDGRVFRQRSVRFFPFPYATIMDYFAEKQRK